MDLQGIGQERAPHRTLPDINPVLFWLFLSDGIPQHTESNQHYPGSGIGDTDGIINVWWKISTHTAAIGGVAGGLVVYSIAFSFNPIWWLAFVILLAGMVGTARMILRQHTLAQVVAGFLVGVVCALFII